MSAMPRFTLNPYRWSTSIFTGVLIAVSYGVVIRAGMAFNVAFIREDFPAMSIGFIVLVPLLIGFLAVYLPARQSRVTAVAAIILPWLPVLLTCVIAMALAWEGAICIVFLMPIALMFGSLGGLLAKGITQRMTIRPGTVACMAVLPLICMVVESQLTQPVEMRTVENTIAIHADTAIVWQNIQSVPPIAAKELQPSWTHRIGFPRPVAAVLSHPGVGGVRTASFERGLVFYETVTDWQPLHQLAFRIKADTAHIPPTTLDEHVTIGGRYFDVLDGQYRIEPRTDGTILLHLTSHQRLSTDFNSYAGLWSDAVMGSLQSSILQVIQHRCEAQQRAATLSALNR